MAVELKQRIVGGIVIACVLAIFLPILLHKPKKESVDSLPLTIPKPAVVSEMSLQLPVQASDPQPIASSVASSTPAAASTAAKVVVSEQAVLKTSESSVTNQQTPLKFVPEPTMPVTEPMSTPKSTAQPAPAPKSMPAPSSPARVAMTQNSTLNKAQGVNTKILESVVSTPQAWVLQLGSFSQESNANALVKQLHLRGFEAYARQDAAHHVTRVFVGPEIAQAKIQAINKKLQHDVHLKGVVRKYNV